MITARLQKRLIFTIMGFVSVIITILIVTINLAPTVRHTAEIENYLASLVPDVGIMPPPPGPEDIDLRQEPPPMDNREAFHSRYEAIVITYSADGTLLHVDGDVEAFEDETIAGMLSYIEKQNDAFGNHEGLWFLKKNVEDGWRIALLEDSSYFKARRSYIIASIAAGAASWLLFLLFVFYLVRRLTSPVEDAFRKQKQFTADAGHELRTPLATIKANAEVLRREYPESREVGFILSEADRMSGLTEELVALAVIEDSSRERRRSETDLGRAVEAEALAFESLAYENGVSISCECEEGLILKADPCDISRLSSILISNAVKYGRRGGEIAVTVKEERHKGVISVYNTGSGVSAEVLPHLFDRFYRLDSARSSESRSYGLGLSIAAAIVEDYGGTITAESSEGEWMRFTMTLPLR